MARVGSRSAVGNAARQLIQEGLALLNCWGTASCKPLAPRYSRPDGLVGGVIAGAGSMPAVGPFHLSAARQHRQKSRPCCSRCRP